MLRLALRRRTEKFTYYVDQVNGLDTNDGLTPNRAFKTVAKVNTLTLSAGQSVGFRRGCTWRETLTVPSSGNSTSAVTFGAYGKGAKPRINAANVLTSWSNVAGTVYSKGSVTTEPRIVLYNGVRLNHSPLAHSTPNSDLVNETFEGAGTPASWTTSGSPAPNFDTAVSEAGSPAGWGSQCLKIAPGDDSAVYVRRDLGSNRSDVHVRFEFILTSTNLKLYNDYQEIFQALAGSFAATLKLGLQRTAAGPLRFLLGSNHNGSYNGYQGPAVYPNRKYVIELKWSATNTAWGWRVNGVPQINNADATLPVTTAEGTLTSTFANNIRYLYFGSFPATNPGYTMYFDNVQASATDWVGQALPANSWNWTSNTLQVNVGEDPGTGSLEAGTRDYPVSMSDKSYVTFKGLALHNANHSALNIDNSSHITCDGTDLIEGAFVGTNFGSAASDVCDYFTFRNGTARGFGSSGINIGVAPGINGSCNHAYIGHNTVSDNGWKYTQATSYLLGNSAGIKVWGGKNLGADPAPNADVVIEYNHISGSRDQWGDLSGDGIWCDQWGTGAVIRYNTLEDNDNWAIVVENMDDAVVYGNKCSGGLNGIGIYRNATGHTVAHNVVYGASRWGLAVFGDTGSEQTMDANTVQNNISVNNGTNFVAAWGGESSVGEQYTHNCYGAESANFTMYGLDTYQSTYAAFQTAYGALTSNIQADPLLTNPEAGEFSVSDASQCRNTGALIAGINDDFLGTAPDVGAVESA
jgi:hypothetical protein